MAGARVQGLRRVVLRVLGLIGLGSEAFRV